MDVSTSTLDEVPLLILAGEIGHESCPELRRALESILVEDVDRLLLDFTDVRYIDSGCVGLLWAVFRSVAGRGWMGVIGADNNIRRILSVVGLVEDDTFRLFAVREDAKRALAAESVLQHHPKDHAVRASDLPVTARMRFLAEEERTLTQSAAHRRSVGAPDTSLGS